MARLNDGRNVTVLLERYNMLDFLENVFGMNGSRGPAARPGRRMPKQSSPAPATAANLVR